MIEEQAAHIPHEGTKEGVDGHSAVVKESQVVVKIKGEATEVTAGDLVNLIICVLCPETWARWILRWDIPLAQERMVLIVGWEAIIPCYESETLPESSNIDHVAHISISCILARYLMIFSLSVG